MNLVPFPHLIRDDLLTDAEIDAINAEWPVDGWVEKAGATSIKAHTTKLPPTARAVADRLNSAEFRAYLSEQFGIPGLLPDPSRFGAGLHMIRRGGFLGMHVDFNQHPSGLWRRLNLLVYLNRGWQEKWGGKLRLLRDRDPIKLESINGVTQIDDLPDGIEIAPMAGVSVAFATTEQSWHGHPEPLNCPPDRQRRSLALYYYTREAPPDAADPHTTIYRKS